MEDGLTIRWMEDSKTVEIEATDAWCTANNAKKIIAALYTTDGRMIVSHMLTVESDVSVLMELSYNSEEKPNGKLFVLDDACMPLRLPVVF